METSDNGGERGGLLGIDLGGTNLRVAVAGNDGTVLAETHEPAADLTPERFADRVVSIAARLSSARPHVVGVGVPAPATSDGRIGAFVNAPSLNGAPLRALLEARLGIPVTVENDVNLAALAELHHGRGRGARDLVFIAVGTGVGMGIIAGGQIVRGATGGAGEIGALPLSVDHVATDFAQLGPLESVAGGAGLATQWSRYTGQPATGRDVFAAADGGDESALTLLEEQARALAMAIRAAQAMLEPELVVFGGGMGARPDVVERVRTVLAGQELPAPAIAISALGERAGIIGALEAARGALPQTDPLHQEASRVP